MKISPETSNIVHFDNEALDQYLGALFGYYEWGEGESIGLRGLQEKGVKAPGAPFSEMAFVRGGDPVAVLSHAERWNGRGHGAFLIPGIMRAGSADSRQQRDDDVAAFTCLCLDLDNPDRAEPTLAMLEIALGRAGVVVESSSGKLHAYWLFTEPQTDTRAVAKLRHVLALKCGGDPAFQRIVQVIRLPGSIHGKNGIKSPVTLERCEPDCRHDYETLAEKINELHPLVTAAAEAPKELARLAGGSGTMQLSPATSALPSTEAEWNERMLARTVREGGQDGVNRWDAFNKAAGFLISRARAGDYTLDEAKAQAAGWMELKMIPPWPAERFEAEWSGLVKADAKNNGPVSDGELLTNRDGITAPAAAPGVVIPPEIVANPLLQWAGTVRYPRGVQPEREWRATGLVRVGASHVLAAEGGVGKTLSLIELALKIAAPRPGDMWMGQPMEREHTGGTAVLITAEDDVDELHIRINALDPDGRREQAGYRFIVLPLLQAGGAFPLVEIGPGGVARASPSWSRLIGRFKQIPDLQMVAIDTVAATLHGEENASLTLQQYMTALGLVQGKDVAPKASTFVTHHVRKQGTKDTPIVSASDMRAAIRGSNALLGSARMVIGIWQPPSWAAELAGMNKPQLRGTLFRMAVVKANNSEALRDERTVLRASNGSLVDITDAALAVPKWSIEQRAWIKAAVARGVEEGRAFTKAGDDNGLGEGCVSWLPEDKIRGGKPGKFKMIVRQLVEDMKDNGELMAMGRKGHKGLLDVPGGKLTQSDGVLYQPTGDLTPMSWEGWEYHSTTGMVVPGGQGAASKSA